MVVVVVVRDGEGVNHEVFFADGFGVIAAVVDVVVVVVDVADDVVVVDDDLITFDESRAGTIRCPWFIWSYLWLNDVDGWRK